jgi:hypothetical protein
MIKYIPNKSQIVECVDSMLFDVFGVTVDKVLVEDPLILNPVNVTIIIINVLLLIAVPNNNEGTAYILEVYNLPFG